MDRFFAVCTAAVLLVWPATATSFAVPGKSEGGFIEERLQRIDAVLEREIAEGRMPGAVALIARHGDIVYHRSFGYADIESGKPMSNDGIFRIASMTKLLTSVGVMILYERGEFLLTDPVDKYLPEFANPQIVTEVDEAGTITATVAATQPIQIIHLLTHTSGIGYPWIPSAVSRRYAEVGIIDGPTSLPYTLKEQMQLLAEQPLLFEPGSQFAYGLNTDLLGYLIEVVSGQSLAEFIAAEISGPLGMPDTHFYLPEDAADRLVTIYAENAENGLIAAREMELPITLGSADYPVEGARSHFSGGSGLSSTASDYARFIQMLLNDGELDGVRILGRKSVELMRTPRVDLDFDGEPDFGLGLEVIHDIGKAGILGSPGSLRWGGAFDTFFWIDPAEDLVAVLMTQVAPLDAASSINRQIEARFRVLVYQALE